MNFVEQAALASQHYEAKAEQVHCRGKNLGHAWLDGANPWMIDDPLAHPKGLAQGSPWKYAAPAASEEFECVEGAATFVNPNAVSCGSTATAKRRLRRTASSSATARSRTPRSSRRWAPSS